MLKKKKNKKKKMHLLFFQVFSLVIGPIGRISAIEEVYSKDRWLCSDFFEN